MSHYGEFDYLVVNDDFQRALYELEAVLEARRLITARQSARLADTLSNLLAKR
jgi:guanylate kinase